MTLRLVGAVVVWSRHRARSGYRAGLVVARFSVLAAGGVGLAALAGFALAMVRLASVSALWTTSYGLALLAKVAVVGVVGGMGAYNHFVVVSALRADPEHRAVDHLRRLGDIADTLSPMSTTTGSTTSRQNTGDGRPRNNRRTQPGSTRRSRR